MTRVILNRDVYRAYVEQYLRGAAPHGRPMQILEAGCGRRWWCDMTGIEYTLTGVDLDPAAMEARRTISKDLHHAHVDDLRTVTLPAESFDLIYSSYVLEHIDGAEKVLERFVKWLKPGGMIIIRVPDRDSVQGFTARLTPFWVHVWYYRIVERRPLAGTPGHAPYPTFHEPVIASAGMSAFAERYGLELVEAIGHGGYQRGRGVMPLIVSAYAKLVSLISFGKVHAKSKDLTFIVKKPALYHRPQPREWPAASKSTHLTA